MLDLAVDERVILNDKLDCAIQELDLLFNTTNTELIGKTDYGTNFEQFSWQLLPSTEDIKRYVQDRIGRYTYFMREYDYDVEVTTTEESDYRDSYYIHITINVESDDPHVLAKCRKVYMFN